MDGLTAIPIARNFGKDVPLGPMIEALGTDNFDHALFDFLDRTASVDHCGCFWYTHEQLRTPFAFSRNGSNASARQSTRYVSENYWLKDPAMDLIVHQGTRQPALMVVSEITAVGPSDLQEDIFLSENMYHRLLLCQNRAEGIAILDLVRSPRYGAFGEVELKRYYNAALLLLPLVFKHLSLEKEHSDLEEPLRSVEFIEQKIAERAVYFPIRERQVIAHILFGVMTQGIALTLGISEETVRSYRKRAYNRLGIATRHELLKWYFSACKTRH